jgi:hypothetical protein
VLVVGAGPTGLALAAQDERLVEVSAIAQSMTQVLEQLRVGLDQAGFQQRRQLLDLLIDRVVVTNGQVEICDVIPTTSSSTKTQSCPLRPDYFDAGAAAMAQLQGGQVGVGLVGDEHLEAVPVGVGERQLGARWGSSRRQIARVPGGQPARSRACSSATSAPRPAWPWPSMAGIQRWRGPPGQRRGRVRRLVAGGLGELGQGQIDRLDVSLGGVGAGIARPQDPTQCLAGAVTAVQEAHQRVDAEATLVGPGRALLVGVRRNQGAVPVNDQQPVDVRTGPPGRRSGMGAGRPQPGKPVRITGDLLDHPPPRRRGG